jgi:membrane-bound lytic murein transglycosylase A
MSGVFLLLSGCATSTVETSLQSPEAQIGSPSTALPRQPEADSPGPATLPGWADEDHLAGFDAYADGCHVARDPRSKARCEEATQIRRLSRPVTPSVARAFFERGFSVVAAETPDGRPGLMTAYFAPEYQARRRPDAEFDMPVLAKPDGWSRGQVMPERAVIEAGPLPSTPAAWMRTEDLFFMQIQGSGFLTFEDGTTMRAAYSADNGRPFVGIARPMAERGLLPADGTSGEAIRAWLAAHRGREARAITELNPRYIFFSLAPDDGGDPTGAAGEPLPARRAIAVDPASWTYGDLVWISADAGTLAGAGQGYRGLVMALDTGSAIRGPVRADLYLGRGEAAGAEAGSVRHPLRMWHLVPR